jgi:hypothetical protein
LCRFVACEVDAVLLVEEVLRAEEGVGEGFVGGVD